MPLYEYSHINSRGKSHIEALSLQEAKQKLREQGQMVVEIKERQERGEKNPFSGDQLIAFTLQLSQLIKAGVPLYESLLSLEEQYRGEKVHAIILSLSDQIKAGKSLSVAMEAHPKSFDRLYRNMVHAGEAVGGLDDVLEELSKFLQKKQALKKQLTTTLIYPAILASFSLVVILLLLGFVVPSIEGMLMEGGEMNALTRTVLGLSHLFCNYWWVYLPLGALLIPYGIWIDKTKKEIWVEPLILKLPVVKTLALQGALTRFFRTFATLQRGGVSLIDSLRISREVIGLKRLEKEIEESEKRILEGSQLSQELSQSKWFPPMVWRMVAVGEESGNLTGMLQQLATMHEDELEKNVKRFLALLQPVLLLGMGLVIGTILLALLLPMTQMGLLQ